MAYEAYIGYLDERKDAIQSGSPLVLEVRDTDTFERKIVRAIVSGPGEALDDAEDLWVIDWVESRQPDPWHIRILEQLDEEAAAAVRSDISSEDLKAAGDESNRYGSGRGRGASMPEMMGQEEARKYYENLVSKKRNPNN